MPRGQGRGHGRRRADGQRPGLRPLDPRRTATPPPRARSAAAASTARARRASRLTAADAVTVAEPTPLVIFTPSGRRGRFAAGTTVLDAARALGVDIDSVCGGRGICGRCQVERERGRVREARRSPPPPAHLSPFGAVEARVPRPTRASPRTAGSAAPRTSAATLVIDVPPESQVHRQVVRKEARRPRPFDDRPGRPAPLRRGRAARARLADRRPRAACSRRSSASGSSPTSRPTSHVVRALQPALEKGEYGSPSRSTTAPTGHRASGRASTTRPTASRSTSARRRSPGTSATSRRRGPRLGDGVMNPQIRFGEDLMSRVSYVMMHPEGAGGDDRGRARRLDELIAELAMRRRHHARRHPRARDRRQPDHAPPPARHRPDRRSAARRSRWRPTGRSGRPAAELGLPAHPGARVYVLPCIAGHVGADTAGVILAEAPHLGERGRRSSSTSARTPRSCSATATGCSPRRARPARPSRAPRSACGQRAAPGAIERVRIDRETLEPRFRVIGVDAWSDEPGFAAAIAETGITGICGSGIIEVDRRAVPGGRHHDGRHRSTARSRRASPRDRPRRPDLLATSSTTATPPAASRHPERRPRDPARQGRALRGRAAADGPARDRPRRRDPARRCVRQPDRPGPRDGPRPRCPDCDLGQRHVGRQRRRHGRADRAAVGAARGRDRGGRPPRREDRDRRRAALPGALRRGDGVPARDRPRSRTSRAVVALPARAPTDGAAGADAAHGTTPPPRRRGRHEGGPHDGRPRSAAAAAVAPRGRPRAPRARGQRPVPDPRRWRRSRCSTRRACRSSRRTPTRSSRRSGSSSAATPRRCSCSRRRRRRRRRAGPLPARDVPPDRPGDRAARRSPSTRATRSATSRSAACTRCFAPNYGSPFVRDLDNGRRYGTIEDFRNFVKLTYMTPYLHHSGGTVCEPVDVPVNKRHLDMVYAHIRYSRQAVHGLGDAPERARGHGRDGADPVRRRLPRATTRSIVSLDQRQLAAGLGLDDARRGAGVRRGQPGDVLITPFILAGAMARSPSPAPAPRPSPRRSPG